MKFTFLINQAGVVRCGLLGRVGLAALCVLDYIGGWFFFKNSRRAVVEGREFVWLRYEYAVGELPLLFNPRAGISTRKNQLSRLVQGLREAGLIETVKVGRELYLRPTDLAATLASSRERIVTNLHPIITSSRDDTVTLLHDDTVTPTRDDQAPTNIDETTITETTIKEPSPCIPPAGDYVRDTSKSSSFLSEQAETIHGVYPVKVAKPAALRAIKKALAKTSFELLLERTRAFAAARAGDLNYCPHPSTWFNQERFNDDPSAWRPSRSAAATRKAASKFTPGSYSREI